MVEGGGLGEGRVLRSLVRRRGRGNRVILDQNLGNLMMVVSSRVVLNRRRFE